ncbi:hypothetical protein J1614_001184 [Plenodomus biglobosus]|nr:hypothetical protein J1614_001184 [Plenodomus biglobosus]
MLRSLGKVPSSMLTERMHVPLPRLQPAPELRYSPSPDTASTPQRAPTRRLVTRSAARNQATPPNKRKDNHFACIMVNQRPPPSGLTQPPGSTARPGTARPTSSSTTRIGSQPVSRAQQLGLGLGKGSLGLGAGGKGGRGSHGLRRHKKIHRDTIYGVTKGDIRRLARRGGVKRISALVYEDIRAALKTRLTTIMRAVIAVVESSGRSTITVTDIVFILNRLGTPIYGFDPAFIGSRR